MTGPQLRAARHRLGLTQSQLAKRLQVTPTQLSSWEREEAVISPAAQLHCATVFATLLRSPFIVSQRIPCPHCAGAGMVPAVYTLDGGLVPAPMPPVDGRSTKNA